MGALTFADTVLACGSLGFHLAPLLRGPSMVSAHERERGRTQATPRPTRRGLRHHHTRCQRRHPLRAPPRTSAVPLQPMRRLGSGAAACACLTGVGSSRAGPRRAAAASGHGMPAAGHLPQVWLLARAQAVQNVQVMMAPCENGSALSYLAICSVFQGRRMHDAAPAAAEAAAAVSTPCPPWLPAAGGACPSRSLTTFCRSWLAAAHTA